MADALEAARTIDMTLQEGERQAIPEPIRKFLQVAMQRWKTIAEAESQLREEQVKDLRFRASDQWPENVRNMRKADKRPILTINRLPEFIRQVTNAQRQSRPAIKISPIDSYGDQETADVFQGLVRHIENQSNADVAYTNAGEDQATIGTGYWRILTEYEDHKSDKQQIRIKQIANPFSVYMDAACTEVDCSDARYAFIVEDIPKEEFKVRWPKASFDSLVEFTAQGHDEGNDWMPEGKIRVAEYFYTTYERKKLLTLMQSDGKIVNLFRDQWEEMNRTGSTEATTGQPTVGWQKVDEREVLIPQIKWALISAGAILEGNDDLTEGRDWPGKYIPIVRVIGDEIDLNGKKDYRGIVRDARDPQRMVNYWESALTEAIALAPRAPFIVAKGQIENYESQWNTANVRNWPYLQYDPIDSAGKPVPPPQRQSFEPAIQAIAQASMHADQNLKNVTGFQAPSLGELSPSERSGKAIMALQKQAELGSSHYLDNLGRAIRFTGEILVDLIPKVYTEARIMRILGEDQRVMQVMVYAGEDNAPPDVNPEQLPEGLKGIYRLDVGKFDVTAKAGRSFETRREEAVDTIQELFKALPEAAPLGMDILVENMDVPWAKQMSERMKLMLPPAIQQSESTNLPPEAVAQIQQLQQQLEELTQLAQEQGMQLQTDEHKEMVRLQGKQAELESRERIAAGKDATARSISAEKTDTQMDIAALEAKVDLIIAKLGAEIDREKLDVEEEKLDHDAGKTELVEENKGRIEKERAKRPVKSGAA
jgi:hypothetical protein